MESPSTDSAEVGNMISLLGQYIIDSKQVLGLERTGVTYPLSTLFSEINGGLNVDLPKGHPETEVQKGTGSRKSEEESPDFLSCQMRH